MWPGFVKQSRGPESLLPHANWLGTVAHTSSYRVGESEKGRQTPLGLAATESNIASEPQVPEKSCKNKVD